MADLLLIIAGVIIGVHLWPFVRDYLKFRKIMLMVYEHGRIDHPPMKFRYIAGGAVIVLLGLLTIGFTA